MSTTTIDPTEITKNRFLGKTATVPRPTGEERDYQWSGGREHLAKDRRQWDDAAAWAAQNDAIRAERLARLDAEKAAKQRADGERDAARRTAERDRLVGGLRARFLAQPGATEADWARNRDAVLDEHFRRQVDDAARREHARIRDGF